MYEKLILTIVIIMTLSHQTKCVQKCRVDCSCYKDNENRSVLECEKGVICVIYLKFYIFF